LKKTAATVSLLIGSLLLLVICVSFGCAVYDAHQRMSPDSIKADTDAALAGKEIVEPTDNRLDSSTLVIFGIGGAAFLVAGLALWPKEPTASA